MPRGRAYPEELRQEARRLRCEGWSLNEISARLGPPKNTLTLWVRGIELTPQQRARLFEKEHVEIGKNRALAAAANRKARIERIDLQRQRATTFLDTLASQLQVNHVAAAMLYVAEGSKADTELGFANSNPHVIRYWLYLLRSSFVLDDSKFVMRILYRADQDFEELKRFWAELTGIARFHKSKPDPRTVGIPTKRADYRGVCQVIYFDVSLRRYLDALAHELMARAELTGNSATA